MRVDDPFALLRACLIPLFLGVVLICLILVVLVVVFTPSHLNPADAVVLRAYLISNNDALNTPKGTNPTPQRFVVAANDNARTIGINLVTQGFIDNGTLFSRYVEYEGRDKDLRVGTFFISEAMTIPEIVDVLTDPTPTTVTLTVIEGWRLEQIAAAVDSLDFIEFTGAEFLAVAGAGTLIPPELQAQYGIPAGVSLEGFLFPATYEIPIDATAENLRDQMLQAFANNVTSTMIRDASAAGRTMYQVVTLASIVEREAVLPAERPTIASVYLNRLEIGQKLDADPTTQYAIGNTRDGNWWPQITQADYQLDALYNTYVYPGLPPGPIANPSISAIRGVIYPAETPYFYFRAACDGSGAHQFSITYEEHISKGCP